MRIRTDRIRALPLLLAALLLMAAAAGGQGCAPGPQTPPDGTSGATTEEQTAAPETEMKLVDHGVANFRVIRNDRRKNDDEDVLVAVQIKKALNVYATVTPAAITTDWGNGDDTEKYEILVGDCDYPCVRDALPGLGYGEYLIKLDGRKIMVLSQGNLTIEDAGARFLSLIEEFRTENDDGTVSVIIPVDRLNIAEKAVELISAIPAMEGITLTSQIKESKNAIQLFFSRTTYEQYVRYTSLMLSSGYRSFMTGTTTDEYKAFAKDNLKVTVRYSKAARRMEVDIEKVKDVSKMENCYGLITAAEAVIRTEPREDAPESPVGKLKKYDVAEVVDSGNTGWYKVVSGDASGYCRQKDMRTFTSVSALKAFAAVVWARDIVADDDFHYGYSSWAHHYGCYFCGTNSATGTKVRSGANYEDQLKTYCCNPFVTAAYCHGAGGVKFGKDVSLIVNCVGKNINLANDSNPVLQDARHFALIEKPANVMDLRPGDILLTPSHAMLYTENGMVAEASGSDDNVRNSSRWNNSIRERSLGSSYENVTKVYRYIFE
jgi:hypothetical protein